VEISICHVIFLPDGFYLKNVLFQFTLLGIVLYLLSTTTSLLPLLVAGVAMGFYFQQVAFIGHDAGHHLITHDQDTDEKIGFVVGNTISGISIGWWKRSHNAHHVVTNSVNCDPDIQHLPVFAITDKFFKPVMSTYHDKIFFFDKISKFFVSNQHLLYYVIMGVARFNLYVQSFIHILTRETGRRQKLELVTMAIFWCWFSLLVSLIPTLSGRVIFVLLSHFIAGLLHVQITISHFSMATYHGLPSGTYQRDSFFISQMATTMNVNCYPHLDFFHGGLQFQIEHHLFPRVSRPYLRVLSKKIQKLCKKQDVPYCTHSFYEANKEVISSLKETAEKAQCLSSFIWDGINAVG
jgi:delta8-fatty-acid desaturase